MKCPICLQIEFSRICDECLASSYILEDITNHIKQEYLQESRPHFSNRNELSSWVVDKCATPITLLNKAGVTMPRIEKALGIDMLLNRSIQAKLSHEKSNNQEWRIYRELQDLGVSNLNWDCRISKDSLKRVDFLFYIPPIKQWWAIDCFDHNGEIAIKAEIRKKIARGYHNHVDYLFLVIPDSTDLVEVDSPSNVFLLKESELYDEIARFMGNKS